MSSFPDDELEQFTDLAPLLGSIQTPSLIMSGKFDFVVPPAVGLSAFRHLGTEHKRFVVFEQSAHQIPFNETNKFLEEVVSFIEAYRHPN